MNFKYYLEMAKPRKEDLAKKYYHGTSNTNFGESILKKGIQPPDLTLRKGKLRPREGKVYITPYLSYAQIYAIGGDIAGTDHQLSEYELKNQGQYGYLFVINGNDLKDIEPDEDGVGEYVSMLLNKKENELSIHEMNFLHNYVTYFLTPKQKQKVKSGEYEEFAHVGKKIIPRLNIDDTFRLIDLPNIHVAHGGKIQPIEVWKIDKVKIKELKRDGSNFFKVAERVK